MPSSDIISTSSKGKRRIVYSVRSLVTVRNQLSQSKWLKGKSFKIFGKAIYTFVSIPKTTILLYRIHPCLSVENHVKKKTMKFLVNAPNSMASGRMPEI